MSYSVDTHLTGSLPPPSKKKLKFHSTVNGKSVPVDKVLDEGPGVGGGGGSSLKF